MLQKTMLRQLLAIWKTFTKSLPSFLYRTNPRYTTRLKLQHETTEILEEKTQEGLHDFFNCRSQKQVTIDFIKDKSNKKSIINKNKQYTNENICTKY